MTEADLRPFLDAKPFEPFTVHMTSRSTYDINRPEDVTVSPGGAMELRCGGQVWCVLSTDHITSLSFLAPHIVRGES